MRHILLILTLVIGSDSSACVRLKRIENDIECVLFTCGKVIITIILWKELVGTLFRK